MQFSIRSILLLIFILAAWPALGSIIAPGILIISSAIVILTAVRRSWRSVAFRRSMAVFLATISLYLSFGPAIWVMARYIAPDPVAVPELVVRYAHPAFQYVYEPIAWDVILAPEPLRQGALNYLHWWMPNNVEFRDWQKQGIGWIRGPNSYTFLVSEASYTTAPR